MTIRFKEFLTEEKNTHMTHIEDMLIDGGYRGAIGALQFLRSLRDMLSGRATQSHDVTVKWDGAPAVYAGKDPTDGEFFVAKKGIFNKNPKVYKTHADIDEDIGNSDLANKLHIALDEFVKLGIDQVIQGDIMFTSDDLKMETIDDQKYVTFHPNTIVYAIPTDTELARKIMQSEIGVVWHTSYKGDSFENMKADYGVDASKLRDVRTVWSVDAGMRDLSGTATLTQDETKELTQYLITARKALKNVPASLFRDLASNGELVKMVHTYNNSLVRRGETIRDTAQHTSGLYEYVADKYDKKIESMKSERGKDKWRENKEKTMEFFSRNDFGAIKSLFDAHVAIAQAKLILISKLNKLQSMDTFVKTKNGFKVTGAEGFVAIDRFGGNAVKLVDRMEFSTNNFSSDIVKGWDR